MFRLDIGGPVRQEGAKYVRGQLPRLPGLAAARQGRVLHAFVQACQDLSVNVSAHYRNDALPNSGSSNLHAEPGDARLGPQLLGDAARSGAVLVQLFVCISDLSGYLLLTSTGPSVKSDVRTLDVADKRVEELPLARGASLAACLKDTPESAFYLVDQTPRVDADGAEGSARVALRSAGIRVTCGPHRHARRLVNARTLARRFFTISFSRASHHVNAAAFSGSYECRS